MNAATETPALAATAQHIRLLQEKRDRLTNALVDAELQYLAALRREYDAGATTMVQLRDAYDFLAAGKAPGVSARWRDQIPVSRAKAHAHAKQEERAEADGSWRGVWPIELNDAAPLKGQSVVYVLFDADHGPVYVGSTSQLRIRLATHSRDGKVFRYWIAHPCRDRDHAFEVEARFLHQYMPALNVNLPRMRGGEA